MKQTLYVHCGMHKTGSSFLQTMFARNRKLLERNSIYYPKSERDLDMIKGEISPGNGVNLASAVLDSESKVLEILEKDYQDAEKLNLYSVLYSSENLFHSFAKKGAIENFYNACKQAGFNTIKSLVYFRDPVSHIMSVYKHRAKEGDLEDFDVWLESDYETLNLIQSFLNYQKKNDINWNCRLYCSDSSRMVNSSFNDWLNIKTPVIPEDDRVNRSLKLSEIRIIQTLGSVYPGCETFLREAFLSLPTGEQCDDKNLTLYYSGRAAAMLKKDRPMFEHVNRLLPPGETLSIISEMDQYADEYRSIPLSPSQIKAVANGVVKYRESKKTSHQIRSLWTRGVKKIKRKWFASKISFDY